ncbi:hypothetical protein RFI_27704 [Reticulomyxa filosa]|uniref:PKD/REJ-like domain-containing protein n=1 Tax=Reticulomyxa filosa TaxID=46433 RepID=X6M6Q6_RETFI|nr:hypothetical protein RFI_27704 [Reticulomyxa filosa]|eukprot:ETO09673.1 hypothetical protein RFI_27704 [Reticulomyxa filosa]
MYICVYVDAYVYVTVFQLDNSGTLSTTQVQTSITLTVTPPPTDGQCTVTPSDQGTAFSTWFAVNCSGFTSMMSVPLTYEYYLPSQQLFLSSLYSNDSRSYMQFQLGSGTNISIEAMVGNTYNYVCYPLVISKVVLNATFKANATAFLSWLEKQGSSTANDPSQVMQLSHQALQVLVDPNMLQYVMIHKKKRMMHITIKKKKKNDYVPRIASIRSTLSELLKVADRQHTVDCETQASTIYSLLNQCALLSGLATSGSYNTSVADIMSKLTVFSKLVVVTVKSIFKLVLIGYSNHNRRLSRAVLSMPTRADIKRQQSLEQNISRIKRLTIKKQTIYKYMKKKKSSAGTTVSQQTTVNNCMPHRFQVDMGRQITVDDMAECIFWDQGKKKKDKNVMRKLMLYMTMLQINENWSSNGCWVIDMKESKTECGCNHLNGTVFTARFISYTANIRYTEEPSFTKFNFITIGNIKKYWTALVIPGGLLVIFALLFIFYRSGSDKPLLSNQRALFVTYLDRHSKKLVEHMKTRLWKAAAIFA